MAQTILALIAPGKTGLWQAAAAASGKAVAALAELARELRALTKNIDVAPVYRRLPELIRANELIGFFAPSCASAPTIW